MGVPALSRIHCWSGQGFVVPSQSPAASAELGSAAAPMAPATTTARAANHVFCILAMKESSKSNLARALYSSGMRRPRENQIWQRGQAKRVPCSLHVFGCGKRGGDGRAERCVEG